MTIKYYDVLLCLDIINYYYMIMFYVSTIVNLQPNMFTAGFPTHSTKTIGMKCAWLGWKSH